MPDRRRHRGPHPRDHGLFGPDQLPDLKAAVADLSWLLERGYSETAALKLVGDHRQLQRRQRVAVRRSACAPTTATARRAATVSPSGRPVAVDGFNVLITIEAALSGGVVLRGRDGYLRDLASVHGTWRRVEETARALDLLSAVLAHAPGARWILDRPVSNSGRLAEAIRERGFEVSLSDTADGALFETARAGAAVATSDGGLMDRIVAAGGQLVDLDGPCLSRLPDPWLVDLGSTHLDEISGS